MRFATITCDLVDGPRNGQAIGVDSTLPAVLEFTTARNNGCDKYGCPQFVPVSHFYELDLDTVRERPRYRFLSSMEGGAPSLPSR